MHAPEKGLIALNVPLDTIASRRLEHTDDPPVLYRTLEHLLGILGIPGHIENPYWDKTKGEMVAGCANPRTPETDRSGTLSCASPTKGRWKGIAHNIAVTACHASSAARRLLRSPIPDYTLPDLHAQAWDPQTATGSQIRSFQYAVERLMRVPNRQDAHSQAGSTLPTTLIFWATWPRIPARP